MYNRKNTLVFYNISTLFALISILSFSSPSLSQADDRLYGTVHIGYNQSRFNILKHGLDGLGTQAGLHYRAGKSISSAALFAGTEWFYGSSWAIGASLLHGLILSSNNVEMILQGGVGVMRAYGLFDDSEPKTTENTLTFPIEARTQYRTHRPFGLGFGFRLNLTPKGSIGFGFLSMRFGGN